jgi:hypothetical protein
MNRGGYSDEGQLAMERWLFESAIDRRIPSGEKRSGFVFTHLKPGTKGFNVDLISRELRSYSFTFFVPMPGFTADYMSVDFENLYSEDEILYVDTNALRAALEQMESRATDETGRLQGAPFNIALVGTGEAVRRALLRANWRETEMDNTVFSLAREQYYSGRPPDGVFVKHRRDGTERKILSLWLAPMRVEQDRVWIGQTVTIVGDRNNASESRLISADIDTPYFYLMQDFWYSQSLKQVGFVRASAPVPSDAQIETFSGWGYYTNGLRGILWLSEDPVGSGDVHNVGWEPMPRE